MIMIIFVIILLRGESLSPLSLYFFVAFQHISHYTIGTPLTDNSFCQMITYTRTHTCSHAQNKISTQSYDFNLRCNFPIIEKKLKANIGQYNNNNRST